MSRKYRKFSPEFRAEAVRLVIENSRPITQVARELGVNDGTLGSWVTQGYHEPTVTWLYRQHPHQLHRTPDATAHSTLGRQVAL